MEYHPLMIDQALKVKAMSLSTSDRLELIGSLWDSRSSKNVPVTPAEKTLLDARLADADAHPDDGSPWSESQSHLRKQLPR